MDTLISIAEVFLAIGIVLIFLVGIVIVIPAVVSAIVNALFR